MSWYFVIFQNNYRRNGKLKDFEQTANSSLIRVCTVVILSESTMSVILSKTLRLSILINNEINNELQPVSTNFTPTVLKPLYLTPLYGPLSRVFLGQTLALLIKHIDTTIIISVYFSLCQ